MQVTDLNTYRRQREASEAPQVFIRGIDDPLCANRRHYLITSRSREAVQNATNSLMAEVESFGNGCASFEGPFRGNAIFFAYGSVQVWPVNSGDKVK